MAQSTDRLVIPDFDVNAQQTLQRQIRDILAFNGGARRAQGSLTFSGQPSDGETLILDDGRNTAVTFEADDDSSITPGNVSVIIGSDAEETLDNLLAAINAQIPTASGGVDPLEITATKSSATVIILKNNRPGTAGNTTITNSWTNLTEVSFTLGQDIGQLDTEMTADIVVGDIDLGAVNLLDSGGTVIDPATSSGPTIVEKNPTILTKAVTTPGTAEAFGASAQARSIQVYAGKVDGENVGFIYIGTATVDKDASKQIRLQPGQVYEFNAPVNSSFDLDAWFIDADNAGDGITGIYIPA